MAVCLRVGPAKASCGGMAINSKTTLIGGGWSSCVRVKSFLYGVQIVHLVFPHHPSLRYRRTNKALMSRESCLCHAFPKRTILGGHLSFYYNFVCFISSCGLFLLFIDLLFRLVILLITAWSDPFFFLVLGSFPVNGFETGSNDW